MAKSAFAKYAERFSIVVIALIIVAWVALTFFADDSQGPDPDQIDDSLESDAGGESETEPPVVSEPDESVPDDAEDPPADAADDAQPGQEVPPGASVGAGEPGAVTPGDDEASDSGAGVGEGTEPPVVSEPDETVPGDAGTDGGVPSAEGDPAEDADEPTAATSGDGDAPEGGEGVGGETEPPLVSEPDETVPGDAGTESGVPPAEGDPAEDADELGAATSGDGDAPEGGEGVGGETEPPLVSEPDETVPGDAGTEGGAPPADGDPAEDADEPGAATSGDGDAPEGGEGVGGETEPPLVSEPDETVPGDAGTEGGAPPAEGDPAEDADEPSAATSGDGDAPEGGEGVGGETEQPLVSEPEEIVPGDAGTEGGAPPAEGDPAEDADELGAATSGDGDAPEGGEGVGGETEQPLVSEPEEIVPGDAGTEGGAPPAEGDPAEDADEPSAATSGDGDAPEGGEGVGGETEQPLVSEPEEIVPGDAGTEGGAPPAEGDPAEGAADPPADAADGGQPGREVPPGPSDGADEPGAVTPSDGDSPKGGGGADGETESPAVPEPDETVPGDSGTEGGVPPADGDSAKGAADPPADATEDGQPGREVPPGPSDGAEESGAATPGDGDAPDGGEGVGGETEPPAVPEPDETVPGAGTEGGVPPAGGDPAEGAADPPADAADDAQPGREVPPGPSDGAEELGAVTPGDGDAPDGGEGVGGETDSPAVSVPNDGVSDDAGVEGEAPPADGDPAEDADGPPTNGVENIPSVPPDDAGELDTDSGTELGDEVVDATESGQQVAMVDPEFGTVSNTETKDGIGTPTTKEAAILPTFDVVRVDQFGFATIAGRGMPNWPIDVLINSELKVSDRISRDGQFAFILQLDTEGSPLEIALLSRDGDGAVYRSPETVVIFAPESVIEPKSEEIQLTSADSLLPAVLIATPEKVKLEQPPIPIQPAGSPGENLQIDSISYDMTGEVVLAGRGSAKGFVRVYLDNLPIKTEQITDFGTWEIALPEVDAGRYMLKVEELDQSKKVVASIVTPFQKEFREDALEKMKEAVQASGESGVFDLAEGRIADIVTVQPGYTLWGISRRSFGQGRFYVRIYHTNIDQIDDPDLIFPGQLLVVPNLDTAPPRRPFN